MWAYYGLLACFLVPSRSKSAQKLSHIQIKEEGIAMAGMGELILGFVTTPVGAIVAILGLVGAGLFIRSVLKS
jgi:hypothetical protein